MKSNQRILSTSLQILSSRVTGKDMTTAPCVWGLVSMKCDHRLFIFINKIVLKESINTMKKKLKSSQ